MSSGAMLYTFNGCTSMNQSACGVVSNITANTVINPVMVANLHEWKIR